MSSANCGVVNYVENNGEADHNSLVRRIAVNADKYFGDSAQKDKYVEFFEGFQKNMFEMGGANKLQAALNIDNTLEDMDTFVKQYTHYDGMKAFLAEENPAEKLRVSKQLKRAMEQTTMLLASSGFKKDAHVFNKMDDAFHRELKHLHRYIVRGDVAGIVLAGDFLIGKGKMLLGNYAQSWEKHPIIYKLEMDQSDIYAYSRNYFTKAKSAFTQIFSRNLVGKTKLNAKMAEELLKVYDNQYKMGSMKDVLIERGITNDDDIKDITARMDRINEEWQVLNYGDTLANIKAKGVPYDPSDKAYNYENNKIQYEEDGVPKQLDSYLYAINHMGKEAVKLIKHNSRTSELHESELKLLHLFKEGGEFKPRMNNYIPSDSDNMISRIFSSGEYNGLFRDVPFLKHISGNKGIDPKSRATDSFVRNNQAFQHMIDKVTSYSTQMAKLGALSYNGNAFARTNPLAYKLIKYETERRIKSFTTKTAKGNDDPMSRYLMSIKKFVVSYNSFIGTSILNLSAPTNLAAGTVSIANRLGVAGITEHMEYLKQLKSSGWQGDLSRRIKDFMEHESPISSKSDELVRPDTKWDKNNWVSGGLEQVSHMLDKASEWNTEKGIYSLIPLMKSRMSFNNSENQLTRINESLLYKEVNDYILGAIRSEGIDTSDKAKMREITDEAIDLFKVTAFMRSKQAIGYFDAKTKPFWTHDVLANAETAGGILLGAFLQQAYMFKHVEFLNLDMINRGMSTLTLMDPKQLQTNMLIGATNASPLMASAIMGMGIYDILADDRMEEMTGWKAPKYFKSTILDNIAPTNIFVDTGMTAASLYYHTVLAPQHNLPVSKTAMSIIAEFGLSLAGVWFNKRGRYGDMIEEAYDGKLGEASLSMVPDVCLLDKVEAFGDPSKSVYDMSKDLKAVLRRNVTAPILGFPISYSNDNLRILAEIGTAIHGFTRAVRSGESKHWKEASNYVGKTISDLLLGAIYFPNNEKNKFTWQDRSYDSDLATLLRDDWGYKGNKKKYTAYTSFLKSMERGKFYDFGYYLNKQVEYKQKARRREVI